MKKKSPAIIVFLAICYLILPVSANAQNCSASGSLIAPAGGSVTTATTLKVYNSTEAGPNSAAARNAVELQDDDWRNGVIADNIGNGFVTFSDTTTAQNLSAPLPQAFSFGGITVSYDFRDFPTNYRSISYPCIGDQIANTALRRTFLSKRTDMQTSPTTGETNEAPRPAGLHNTANHPLIYDEIDQTGRDTTINATVFTFSTPIRGFGAWFGDVESRTDGNNDSQPMTVRLLDTAGNRIGNDILIEPRANQATCSGNNTGCGNRVTRWIGFTDAVLAPRVKQMVLIIGYQGGNGSPDTQRFSFIGPTLPLVFTAAPAGIGGRVLSPEGKPVRNSSVSLQDLSGQYVRTTRTNSFGHYQFNEIPVGENYIVSVSSKRWLFNSQVVMLEDNITNLDFMAIENQLLSPILRAEKSFPAELPTADSKRFDRILESADLLTADF